MSAPLPDMTAEWKVIRDAADALAEVVDRTVDILLDNNVPGLPDEITEEYLEALADQVYDLVTTGKYTPPSPDLPTP